MRFIVLTRSPPHSICLALSSLIAVNRALSGPNKQLERPAASSLIGRGRQIFVLAQLGFAGGRYNTNDGLGRLQFGNVLLPKLLKVHAVSQRVMDIATVEAVVCAGLGSLVLGGGGCV